MTALIAEDFATAYASDNPRFSKTKFLETIVANAGLLDTKAPSNEQKPVSCPLFPENTMVMSATIGGYYVETRSKSSMEGWIIAGPTCETKAEAVREWNEGWRKAGL
jgi:hypothetical protein